MAKTNEQVAQAWAAGKEATGSNFYTEGERLYSYSTQIGCKRGEVAFISASSMTQTTARQRSKAITAAQRAGLLVISTPAFEYGRGYVQTVQEMLDAAMAAQVAIVTRARKAEKIEAAKEEIEAIKEAAKRCGVVCKVSLPEPKRAAGPAVAPLRFGL